MYRSRFTPGGSAAALIAALSFAGAASAGPVIFVDSTRPNGGDGSSWESAFNDLNDALDAAIFDDDLWVAAGVYTPAGPNGDRNAHFSVTGVRLFGGFAGDELVRSERDWITNETILSGDLNGNDGPDFQANSDNSRHIMWVDGSTAITMVNGFTISGGNGTITYGGAMFAANALLDLRHCVFRSNIARAGGAVYVEYSSLALLDCTFKGNDAEVHGAGLRIKDCMIAELNGCSIEDNRAAVGGGIATDGLQSLIIRDTEFIGNRTVGGGAGAFFFATGATVVERCYFTDNDAGAAGGAGGGMILGGGLATVRDCLFAANYAGDKGAGIASDSVATMINCVFSRGIGGLGGGVFASEDLTLINCTFSNNEGHGVLGDSNADISMTNTILWGNIPDQVADHPQGSGADFSAFSCDIQGGWSDAGSNNIDADPLFVQPGADNVRLSHGSPCLNAGDNSAVPPHVVTDLDGNPRIQDGVVDMGAYEGANDPLPASAVAVDLDPGDFEFLAPNGVGFHPEEYDTVLARSYTGADDATMAVTETSVQGLTDPGGFSVLGTMLEVETTMSDGEFGNNLFMVFDVEDLGGADPLELDVTYLDASTGNWALAVSGNTANSPGHPRPMGDRIAVEGPGNWGISNSFGDWGVYYDSQAGRGFAWANVDFAAVFAFGVPLCPADVVQPPDGSVDFADLQQLLFAWGAGPGPFDIDNNGTVDVIDLVLLLDSWGTCID